MKTSVPRSSHLSLYVMEGWAVADQAVSAAPAARISTPATLPTHTSASQTFPQLDAAPPRFASLMTPSGVGLLIANVDAPALPQPLQQAVLHESNEISA